MEFGRSEKTRVQNFKMAKESSGQHQHKPGPLKQQNKSHKHGRHKTKGMLDTISKGSCFILNIHVRIYYAKSIKCAIYKYLYERTAYVVSL